MRNMRLAVIAASLALATNAAAQAAEDTPRAGAFSDAESVSALQAANQAEVDAADASLNKATRSEVKSFARRMKKDHSANLSKLNQVASEQNISGVESDFSRSLKTHSQEMLSTLRPLGGADYDRAYIDGMVADHQALLDALDSRMIPGAQDSKLKAFLQKTRATVADHLREARRIQERIGGGTGESRGMERERAVEPQERSYPEGGSPGMETPQPAPSR